MTMDQHPLPAAVTMPGDTPVWLTVDEAAARARCGVKVIYRAVKIGTLKAAKIGGRGDLRFRAIWIDEFLERSMEPQEIKR